MSAPRRPRRAWRWARRALIALLALIALILSLLITLLATETGAGWLLHQGVTLYDGLIPGGAQLEAVEGSLIDDLTLRGLTLKDRRGAPLVEIKRLRLAWSPARLLSARALEALTVEIDGLKLTLRAYDGQSALLDLAPPAQGPPPPPPPRGPTLIPALPLPIAAVVEITGVEVWDATGGAPTPLVLGLGVTIAADLKGVEGRVALSRLKVKAPIAQDLNLQRGALTLGWIKNRFTLSDLRIETNKGRVMIPKLEGDLDALRVDLALRAVAPKALIAALAKLPPLPADPEVSVALKGGLYGFEGGLRVQISPEAAVEIDFKGQILPHIEAQIDLRFKEIRPDALGAPATARLTGLGRVEARAPPRALRDLASIKPQEINLNVDLSCPGCEAAPIGRFDLDLKAELRPGAAKIELNTKVLGVNIHLNAAAPDLDLKAPLKGALEARWRVNAPALTRALALIPALNGKIQAAITTQGRCQGVLEALRCVGSVEARGIQGFGASVASVDLKFNAQPTRPQRPFEAEIKVRGAHHAAAMGAVDLDLHAQGTPKRVDARLDLRQRRRGGRDRVQLAARIEPGPPLRVRIDALEAQALGHEARLHAPTRIEVNGGRVSWGAIRLQADGAALELAPGRFDPQGAARLGLKIRGFDLRQARRAVPDLPAEGQLDLTLDLKGSLARPEIDLQLRGEALRWQGKRLGDLDLDAGYRAGRVEARLAARGAPDRREIKLKVEAPLTLNLAMGRARWRPEGPHRLELTLSRVDSAWVSPWVKALEAAPFEINLDARLEGASVDALAGTIHLDGEVQAPQIGAVPLRLDLKISPTSQALELRATALGAVEARLTAEAGVEIKAARLGRLDPQQIPIEARLEIPNLPLKILTPWLPDELSRPEGRARLEATVSGRVGRPQIKGEVTLDEGALTVAALGQRLRGMRARIALHDRGARIDEIRFKGGEGEGRLRGEVTLDEQGVAVGALTLTLDKFPLLNPGVPPSRLDTQIDVALRADPKNKIEVDVEISKTALRILSLDARAPQAIPSSDALTFKGEATTAPTPKAAPGPPGPPGPPIHLSVRFKDPLDVRGPLVDMRWGGGVQVDMARALAVRGSLKAERGGFDLLGNRFELETGEVTLSSGGAVDPYLNLVAHAETPEARVTAQITGRAAAPKLTLSAQPPLPQYQILTLLVTGSVERGEEGDGQVERKAARLLAAFQNADLERQLQDRISVDRVRVSFGDSVEEPIVALGKTLSPWLYVETRYHHNAPEAENETEIRGEVRLAPRWTLETLYGDAGIGGVDVFWRVPLGD
ncbi:translocation/assembly module TamB [Myxococcota bacterium]|nr:translocation/assembly module TamB [Myxococcota bacterium]